MALSDELSEALAQTVTEKQETEAGTWVPYVGPDGGEGWQNAEDPEDVRYQEEPPGEVAEGHDADHWENASDFQERMDVEEVKHVFDNIYDDEYDYRSVDHAAARLVIDEKAAPETVADALIERNEAMTGDLWTSQGRIAAENIGSHTTGPTKWGVNMPLVTDDAGYSRRQAMKEFKDEIAWARHIPEIVNDGINEWKLGMFTGECAPMFQLAADITGNETLPEGGAHGEDEHIPSVMEMSVAYEDKEAFEAKMEQTQEILREAFGDTITVYRGISPAQGNPTYAEPSNASEKLAEAKDRGDPAVHEHRPVESWTTNAQYASRYAKGMAQGNPEEGVLLRKEVPVERVMLSSHTSRLAKRESEVIVMHDEEWVYHPDEIMKADEIDDRWLIEEALEEAKDQRDLTKQDVPTEPDPEADSTIRIEAEEINPHWLHRDPPGENVNLAKQDSGWVPYVGPEGGEGWQDAANPDDVRYQEDPPGEVADGYAEDYWQDDEEEGYYDEHKWGRAFIGTGTGWTSPGDVPEGTVIEFETNTGSIAEGVVEDVWWGNEKWDDPAHLQVNLVDDDAEFSVSANDIVDVLDVPGDEDGDSRPEFSWDTDVPQVNEIRDNTDVLYVDRTGVRRVGEFEQPTFVEGVDGTYPGMELADGTEVRLEQVVAVDEGPVPLEPREDPYEFEDYRDATPGLETSWDDALEYTPFDHPGEIPLGATVQIDATNHPDAPGVTGTLEGELVGYWEGDADISEPNGLEIEVPDHGKMVVFPDDVDGFVGPNREVSTAKYLSDPFEYAEDITGSREAGIGDGNTTGEYMKILTMPDDSRVFATPVKAYNNTSTGVVSGSTEARRNNLNSPIVINHLGGNACRTDVAEGPDGTEFIVKEGIEGSLLKSKRWDIDPDDDTELVESLEETLAAAYFVGNKDLHGANIMVNMDEQKATIIDHDSAGPPSFGGGWMDVYRLARGPARTTEVEENIYEICREYMRGETDIPESIQGSYHEDHFKTALDSIVNETDHEAVFDPWETSSHEPVDGFEGMDAFEPGMEVTVLSESGRVRTATLTDEYQGTWYGESEDGYEVSFDMPHHVLEVHGDTEPANAPEYQMAEFDAGDRLVVSPGALSDEEVVVEEYDDEYNRLRVHPVDDPDDVFHVDRDNEVVDVLDTDVDAEELDIGEEIEVEDDDGQTYSGTFMGYTDGSNGGQIEIQDEPGRVVTVDAPQDIQRLTGDSQ